MQGVALRRRVRAELVGQDGLQSFVGGQRLPRPGRVLVRQHHGAVRFLVERIGLRRGLGGVHGTLRVAELPGGQPRCPPGPAQQPRPGGPGRFGPVRVWLVLEHGPAA